MIVEQHAEPVSLAPAEMEKTAVSRNCTNTDPFDPIRLFSLYMKATDVPRLENGRGPFGGKNVGVVNGSSWTSLWSTFFGKRALPGARIINVGSEAVQLNFMRAHRNGLACPPQINIDTTARYAEDLVKLARVDAILLSCSTMNRAAPFVRDRMRPLGVPVVQIDEPMMESAVARGGRILVVATHGPTVRSTQALLQETAARLGKGVAFAGATVEKAFDLLGQGRIEDHNQAIARAIWAQQEQDPVDQVVLAQLSMTVFKLSYPDCERSFGVPVLTSGELGFARIGELLARPVSVSRDGGSSR